MPMCPYCKRNFPKRDLCFKHMNDQHAQQLEADGLDAPKKLWLQSHPSLNGNCVCGCGRKTEWNPKTGKPYRLSNDPSCRQRMKAIADANMMKVYGKTTLLDDMEQQKKMLNNRHISGTYKFSDGGSVSYTGKLENNFLQFCDKIMEFKSNQIIESPEVFTYHDTHDDVDRHYIPDYYLPDYNLLVEIKDGNGEENTNPAFIRETKYKVALKDAVMKSQTKYNYIRISGKNYGPFLELLVNIVRNDMEDSNKPRKNLVVITEAACTIDNDELDSINCDQEVINGNDVKLLVTYDPNMGTVNSVGITDSKYMTQWYITDYTSGVIKCTSWDNDVFTNCDYKLYKFAVVGEDSKTAINDAFHAIMNACESAKSNEHYEIFDILDILAKFNVFFDDGKSVHNNELHKMNFIMTEQYKYSDRKEDHD